MFKIRRLRRINAGTECKVHVIAPDSLDEKTVARHASVKDTLLTAGFNEENLHFHPGAYLPREPVVGCSMSHLMAVQRAFKNTSPFILLENDAVFQGPNLELEVPDDADAIFLGISSGGLALNASKPIHHWKGNYYSWCRAQNLVRIYNMLSTHAVLICSDRYARHWQLCALEGVLRGDPIDCIVARSMRYFNVYAQQKPWFYQADHLGGCEKYTRIEFEGTQINSPYELPNQLASFRPPCISADLAAL